MTPHSFEWAIARATRWASSTLWDSMVRGKVWKDPQTGRWEWRLVIVPLDSSVPVQPTRPRRVGFTREDLA